MYESECMTCRSKDVPMVLGRSQCKSCWAAEINEDRYESNKSKIEVLEAKLALILSHLDIEVEENTGYKVIEKPSE